MRNFAAFVALLGLIVTVSAYDIVRAASVRCVRVGDERRVLSVGEMDSLHAPIAFSLERIPRLQAANRSLTLHGTAGAEEHGAAAAVIAVVDSERFFPAKYGSDGNRFSVALAFTPGSHDVRFKVVASDLTGFYEPEARIAIVAR